MFRIKIIAERTNILIKSSDIISLKDCEWVKLFDRIKKILKIDTEELWQPSTGVFVGNKKSKDNPYEYNVNQPVFHRNFT